MIFVLPPNTTHCTQPLDKGAFSVLKTAWREVCHKFMCNNPGRVVSRYDFASLFAAAWGSAMTLPNVVSGFRMTGVYPFNRNAFQLIGEGNQSTTTISSEPSDHRHQQRQKMVQFSNDTYIPLFSPRCPQSGTSLRDDSTLPRLKPISSISKHLVTPKLPRIENPVKERVCLAGC